MIEHLYERVYLGEKRSVITMDDIIAAIDYCNEHFSSGLSKGNPANFMKDIVRSKNASAHWPQSLKDARITGRQRVGEGRVLEFEPYVDGQIEPFESSFKRSDDLAPIPVQSLSIPLAARSLGRNDESWLIQVAVELRVVETHFAVRERPSPLKVLEIVHLQTGVKLSSSEVDALFFATIELVDGATERILVTCEAKKANERILDHQIIEQIVAANKSLRSAGLEINLIVPIAIQADSTGKIYVAEFEPWTSKDAEVKEELLGKLVLVAEGLYQLSPPVPGVSTKQKRPQRPLPKQLSRRRTRT